MSQNESHLAHYIRGCATCAPRLFCVEVKGKLRLKGFEIVEIEEALDRCEMSGVLDDKRSGVLDDKRNAELHILSSTVTSMSSKFTKLHRHLVIPFIRFAFIARCFNSFLPCSILNMRTEYMFSK